MSSTPSLRQLLVERPVVGTFVKVPRPEIVDVLAQHGLDFLICDTEHGQINSGAVTTVLQAGRAAGISITVRVPTINRGQINRILEAGAAGIQLSTVTSAADASSLRDVTTYPPGGSRSLSTAQPAAQYGALPLPEYLMTSNRDSLRIGQLETAHYADPLEAIIAPLDIAFIGVMDLSVAAGYPGETSHPVVLEQVARIEHAARATGVPLGTFANSVEDAERAIEHGYRYVAVTSDLALLSAGAKSAFASLATSSFLAQR